MASATGMGDIGNMNVRGYITNNVMDWCKNVQEKSKSTHNRNPGNSLDGHGCFGGTPSWEFGPNVAANAEQKSHS